MMKEKDMTTLDSAGLEAAKKRLEGWLAGTFSYNAYRGRAPDGVPQMKTDLQLVLSALHHGGGEAVERAARAVLEWYFRDGSVGGAVDPMENLRVALLAALPIKEDAPVSAPVSGFSQFRRSQIAELAPWTPDFDMTRVRVYIPDKVAGSPKAGDMIARDPKNHDNKWLVSAAYFADNFEPVAPLPAQGDGDELLAAWRDVIAERRRQVEDEGWTPEHDDEHDKGELAHAAAAYANHAGDSDGDRLHGTFWRMLWPFADRWWKPTNPHRDLVKAGALILAEIERRDRAITRRTCP